MSAPPPPSDLRLDGKKLRRARIKANLSQAGLGGPIGIPACTISLWESEYRRPHHEAVIVPLLAEALGVPPRSIMRKVTKAVAA